MFPKLILMHICFLLVLFLRSFSNNNDLYPLVDRPSSTDTHVNPVATVPPPRLGNLKAEEGESIKEHIELSS